MIPSLFGTFNVSVETIPPISSIPVNQSPFFASPNLTQVAHAVNSVASQKLDAFGRFFAPLVIGGSVSGSGEKDACCTEEGENGEFITLRPGSENVTITLNAFFSSNIYFDLVYWGKEDTTCANAKAEWGRFKDEIWGHEQSHYWILRNNITEGRLKSELASSIEEQTTLCRADSTQLDNDLVSALNTIRDQITDVVTMIKDDYEEKQKALDDSASPLYEIDTSYDCN
jgi:hypothetical protein